MTQFFYLLLYLTLLFPGKIPAPSTAIGSLPTPTIGMIFSGPNDIGNHNYSSSRGEGNGIIYTCRAGHIDLGHVRSTADWTRYAHKWIYSELLKGSLNIPFQTTVDPSIFHIDIDYPKNWKDLNLKIKEDQANIISIKLAQYVIFHAGNWHELLTWFGYSQINLFSEYTSSFTWEDNFSNMMGIYLAGDVLLYSKKDSYNKNMTKAIKSEMENFKMFSRNTSINITETVEGDWYSGWIPGIMENYDWPGNLKMLFRGFDIGENDSLINPVLIPNVQGCNENIHPGYYRPFLSDANKFGFKFYMQIEPNVEIDSKLFNILNNKKDESRKIIDPESDISILLNKIKKDAIDRGYSYFD